MSAHRPLTLEGMTDVPSDTPAHLPGTFLLADPHLGHERVRAWTGRPADFETQLEHSCHHLLRPGDHLIIMGDLYLGPAKNLGAQVRRLVPEGVQGTLILGNHDTLSEAAYRRAGLTVVDSLVYRKLLISHMGSLVLPDTARGQLVAHYHQHPLDPSIPHALKISIEEDGLRPLSFDKVYQKMSKLGLLRDLPAGADDRWFLAQDRYAQITVWTGETMRHLIPGRLLDISPDSVTRLRLQGRTSMLYMRRLRPDHPLRAQHPEDEPVLTFEGADAAAALSEVFWQDTSRRAGT